MGKHARRQALLEAASEPKGTGTPCAKCGIPRTVFNTNVVWSASNRKRLSFHYAVCDACRSAKICERLRNNPAAKLVQMGADAAARTRKARYNGDVMSAAECTDLVRTLIVKQGGQCASCKHEVVLKAESGIFMASLDKAGAAYVNGSAQVLCLGCQRLYNDLDDVKRKALTDAIVDGCNAPRLHSPHASLPDAFVRSVNHKIAQMNRRIAATDRPSRTVSVALNVDEGCRLLRECGLRCRATNVPLSSTPGSPFMWSFDRVVAGSAYTEHTVQPVLHRYNDAKFVWGEETARAWLRGFVHAHDSRKDLS